MTTKKSSKDKPSKDPSDTQGEGASAGSGNAEEIIENRRKAKEEAVNTEGVEPPPPVDVNEPAE